jgi:hypothetical protein
MIECFDWEVAKKQMETDIKIDTYKELPLGDIEPQGWLKQQLWLQGIGITGHIGDFWEDLGENSGWLGGTGESWERGPYYCDGLIPLAFLLKDEYLIAKAKRFVDWTIQSQREDGCYGPAKLNDPWPRMVMNKALILWYQATQDSRVPEFLKMYYAYLANWMKSHSLKIDETNQWAWYRTGEELANIHWLYNLTKEESLLELGKNILKDSFDWAGFFREMPFKEKADAWRYPNHVVNVAMGFSEPAYRYWLTQDQESKAALSRGWENVMKYHGMPSGVFSGDECLAGNNPTQGTETCAVVELMNSFGRLISLFGESPWADRWEKIALNALPAAMTPDLWSHCYDQQPNGVLMTLAKRAWTTNYDDSNLMGLEPNFGCCTANLHQGWPKFAMRLWMATSDNGLVALSYAPCNIKTRLSNGTQASLQIQTQYPFRESIQISIALDKESSFPLKLRVPQWCNSPRLWINGNEIIETVTEGYWNLNRSWKDGDQIEIRFPMEIKAVKGYHDSVSIERGPLVYSLKIGEAWSKLKGPEPCPTWEIKPTTAWNYGLIIDKESPEKSFRIIESAMPAQPYDSIETPVKILTRGKKLPQWRIEQNSAGDLPQSPVESKEAVETIELVPFGGTQLRLTAFPVITENH